MFVVGSAKEGKRPIASTPSDDEDDADVVYVKEPKGLKVPTLDPFDGTRSKFKQFLMQVDLYITFNPKKFKRDVDKCLWVVTFLRGAAFHRTEPFVQAHLDVEAGLSLERKQVTTDLLGNFGVFKD
jgi:hypothetical protein